MNSQDLKNLIQEGNFVAFLGAGYSAQAGFPGWRDLLIKTSDKLCPDMTDKVKGLTDKGMYLKAADLVKANVEDKLFYQTVCDVINGTSKNLSKVEPISFLPFFKVITTNYDKSYEKSVALTRGESVSSYSSGQSEVEDFINSKGESVLHLHGDSDRPRSIIIDSSSYKEHTEAEWYKVSLRMLFTTHPFLFVGFSFQDPALKLFIEYCSKYLRFYFNHKSYALVMENSLTNAEKTQIEAANVSLIEFKNPDELWKYINSLKFDQDTLKLIVSKQHSIIPALHILKQKLGIAYAAARLYLSGGTGDTQAKIAGAMILNHLLIDKGTTFQELASEIQEVFVLNKEQAESLTRSGINILIKNTKIVETQTDEYILSDKEFKATDFQTILDSFINNIFDLFHAATGAHLTISKDRIQEFLICSIEANCTLIYSGVSSGTLQNISSLLDNFLTLSESSEKRNIEKALRLGLNNLSKEFASVLRNLALAASAFQTSFYNPEKVLGLPTDNLDSIVIDANVLLPILAESHPDQSFNKRILNQLKKYSKELVVSQGTMQEIVAHLNSSLEEYDRLKDDDLFTSGVYLSSKYDKNVFNYAFAIHRERERIKFTQYVEKCVRWKTEPQLKKVLTDLGFTVLEKNRNREELSTIGNRLKPLLNPDSKKLKLQVLLDHDSEFIYELAKGPRVGLLTYDSELLRAMKNSKDYKNLSQKVINPVQLAIFMDTESLPDIDCKTYIRKILPTGQASIEDVVQSHYLSKAIMDGHKLSMQDLNKVMSEVNQALMDASGRTALDIHSTSEIPVEKAAQLLGYIEPKFVELAKLLDRS